MATRILNKTTLEEKLIWYGLVLTYPCYLFGCLYLLGSVIGWMLFALALLRAYVEGYNPFRAVAPAVWLWVLGMLLMLVALIIAHLERQLGFGQTLKSSIGWAKGWALLALFPLLGSMISIRPEIIVRGVCCIALWSIPFAAVGLLFYVAGQGGNLYLSPLAAVGGPLEAFQVSLYGLNPETGMARWSFIGPWAPAAGLLSCYYLVICLQEKNTKWFLLGIFGSLVMCILCQSRAGWAIWILIIPCAIGLRFCYSPYVLFAIGVLIPTIFLLGQPIIEWVFDSYTQIKESRPDSTRVRGSLARIALQRWESEAPIWGHGIIERGPKIVERMPIGTHHTWYGLLFIKGAIGLVALALPLFFTALCLFVTQHKSTISKTGFLLIIVTVCYSFFENLEILAYLYWPVLLWIGIALKANVNGTLENENTNKFKPKLKPQQIGDTHAIF